MKRGTTIHLRGKDAKNFMQAVTESVGVGEISEGKKHVPLLMAMNAERNDLLARVEKAEAQRDAMARKFSEVSDIMNGHNPPPSFCHACNICPAGSDSEMEGVTCEVRLLAWAKVQP